jgi:histidine decarboxylase
VFFFINNYIERIYRNKLKNRLFENKKRKGLKLNKKELNDLYRSFKEAQKTLLGYTISTDFNYSKLFRFLKFPINNIGDPYATPSNLKINTHAIEKKVIDALAHLFHIPKKEHWGYVTNGGTEGNLYGLYLAREIYPTGIVFLSDQTHYSAMKILRLLRMPYVVVQSQLNGEFDYEKLQEALIENKKKGPSIFFVNIGTTMKGGMDNLKKIHEVISKARIKEYYIHCDAAFYGMVFPFAPKKLSQPFDFREGVDSIAISGHKMIGSPIPCGAVLTKKSHVARIGTAIEYVNIKDTTISGSRNGICPLFLWDVISRFKDQKFEKKVLSCYEKAEYILDEFRKNNIPAWKNEGSLTIVLPRPSTKLWKKWQLPVQKDICCMIALPQLTKKTIKRFVAEFAADKDVQSRLKK